MKRYQKLFETPMDLIPVPEGVKVKLDVTGRGDWKEVSDTFPKSMMIGTLVSKLQQRPALKKYIGGRKVHPDLAGKKISDLAHNDIIKLTIKHDIIELYSENRKRYKRKFQEAGKDVFDKNAANIKKNPSRKDINALIGLIPQGFLHTLRAILHNDLYVWSAPDLLHEVVLEHMNLPHDSATLEFDFSESPIVIRLSATNAKINKLSNLPVDKAAELIMSNPHIEAVFGKYDLQNKISAGPTFKASFQ